MAIHAHNHIEPRAIGLFPGSFNPAHHGHMHVAQAGLKQLALDEVWWIPSPQNPLKSAQPPYDLRADSVAKLIGTTRKMHLSDIERDFGTNKTIDLLKQLERRKLPYRFVLMIGADNFAQLPKWVDWHGIMTHIPVAVIARAQGRENLSLRPRLGPAARLYADHRLAEHDAHLLQWMAPPAWTYLTLPLNPLSSTAIRTRK